MYDYRSDENTMIPGYAGLCHHGARYGGRKKKKEKNNPRTRGHTTATHHSNEPIHPPATLYYSSTAVRSTAVTPTK